MHFLSGAFALLLRTASRWLAAASECWSEAAVGRLGTVLGCAGAGWGRAGIVDVEAVGAESLRRRLGARGP